MALWDDIKRDIAAGLLSEPFSTNDLLQRGYQCRGGPCLRATISSMLANFCLHPPGNSVRQGQRPRFERIARGKYQLLRQLPGRKQPDRGAVHAKEQPASNTSAAGARDDRAEFLRDAGGFVTWLVGALNQFPDFTHCWRARGHINQSGFSQGTLWACTSLFGAYQQYVWPAAVNSQTPHWKGRFFEESETFLSSKGALLNTAISTNQANQARDYAIDILYWGGVGRRPAVAPHLRAGGIPNPQFLPHLRETADHLVMVYKYGFPAGYTGFNDKNGHALRIDSGTTKIYSLLIDEFVMYDGRVASALAFLVRIWWKSQHTKTNPVNYAGIPERLRFSYDAAAGHEHRNPNPIGPAGNRMPLFPRLGVNADRIKENIRASWLLDEVLAIDQRKGGQRSNFSFLTPLSRRLRALEAAIFMVGYDVSNLPKPI